jgi:hypothetical protein
MRHEPGGEEGNGNSPGDWLIQVVRDGERARCYNKQRSRRRRGLPVGGGRREGLPPAALGEWEGLTVWKRGDVPNLD